ncbi:uncharacterized protein LOC131062522 isoform X2 [Cryptomeria japonica]|uniref:uncharacterized protein LOC131062522 isoform X2 n=1 Tax=Cryptomeria japonica TaxID=3369 RepID=UPI0025AD59B7|nr:uncharacterized protein LOC131062522 isoform X2 [Cryptomeria japonica]
MEESTVKNERRTMAPGRNKRRSSSSPSADFEGSNCELVKIELDAAYTLAEFAQVVQRNGEGRLVKQWGRKGRRRRKSYKTGSRSDRSSSQLSVTVKEECHPEVAENPLEICSTNQQAAKSCAAEKEESDGKSPNTCHSVQLKNVKYEPMYDIPNVQPKISVLVYRHGNKLRQPLTEIEKEARRLRRVQANRESARKTIRRKQALRDELSQKAVQLAHENETIKQKTELFMQEYNSLKDRNKQLKEQVYTMQMSSTSRDQVHKTPVDSKVSHIQTTDLPSKQTPNNETPLPPFLWASAFIQASSATQTLATENKQHVIPMENNTLPTTYRNMMPNFCTDPYGNSQSHVPPLVLPYMLPFSLGVQPFALHAKNPPPTAITACASSACESGSDTYVRADGNNILVEAKAERMPESRDLDSPKNQMLQGSSIDNPWQKPDIKPQTRMFGTAISVLPINISSSSITLSNENEVHYGGIPYNKHTLNHSGHWSSQSKELPNPQICHSLPNMGRNLPTCVQEDSLYLEKRLMGAAAASDARKRRKELTRSKHIQARQLKLHC